MFIKRSFLRIFLLLLAVFLISSNASARPLATTTGTAFTYQGRLTDGGAPANGTYDFEFKLYDALTDGVLVGTDPLEDVVVSGGLFTVQLDFGDVFDGTALYLEAGVRPGDSADPFTLLTPRQPLTPTPYALYSLQTDNASLLQGQPGSYYLNATNISSGTLGNSYFDAYSNLGAGGYLGDLIGDLARNNSSLQATLNADLLDGSHVSDFALTSHDHWGASWEGTGTGLEVSGGTTGLSGNGSSYGVYGTGGSYGVWASGLTGVYGTGSNIGVQGGGNIYGMNGFGPTGIYGISTVSGQPGVHGEASGGPGTNYAGLFDGNVQINGSLGITSTTPVTNLNADLLDGLQASSFLYAGSPLNASDINAGTLANSFFDAYANLLAAGYLGDAAGDLARNNGTLQATLNSDQLDGLHAASFADSTHNHWGATWTGSGTGLTLSGGTFGLSGSGSSIGVYGTGTGTGTGVAGDGLIGISGNSTSSGGYAVFGQAFGGAGTDYAGYFTGNVQINGSLGLTSTSLVTNLNADLLDGLHSTSFLTTSSSLNATNINTGTLGTSYYSAYSDLDDEKYLANAAGDLALNNGILQATLNADLLDGRENTYYLNITNINTGTLGTSFYSAYSDLGAELYLGNAAGDLALNNGTIQATLNADLLDGQHAGNDAGNVPLNNSTVNTNLNADLLDGQQAGNGAGNVPLNNTILNTTLNADLLDGIHASALNVDRLDNYHAGNATANVPVNNGTINTSLNSDLLDGKHASAFVPAAQNVVIVAKSGGHFTTITAALASITDASASNPYLIHVAPGIYSEQVTMKEYVDIEGSGELVTKVTFPGSSTFTGTFLGANNAELRFLTVENTGGDIRAISIFNDGASPRLLHVTVRAMGGTSLSVAVYNQFSSSTITDVTASALGGAGNYGMYNYESSPTINNSTISASGGSSNYGIGNYAGSGSYTVQVNNSQVSGSTNTIRTTPYYTTRVSVSQLSGGAVSTGGSTVSCVGVYDENYASAGYTTCP